VLIEIRGSTAFGPAACPRGVARRDRKRAIFRMSSTVSRHAGGAAGPPPPPPSAKKCVPLAEEISPSMQQVGRSWAQHWVGAPQKIVVRGQGPA
jgi:hypothetical protein